jgi:peptidoglycan/LPS O-acetylase OafA/YrhL
MYVFHVPMIPILYLVLQRLARLCHFELRSELATLTLFCIFGSACVFLAAVLSFHLFERPFLKLKIRFNYSARSAPAADSIVASR